MAKKFDLSALMGDVSELDTVAAEVVLIPLESIARNPLNFYSVLHDSVADLADSIRHNGQLEPLVVRPDGEGYRLLSGHRRLAALNFLAEGDGEQFSKARCIIERRELTEAQETCLLIEANRQRIKTPFELGVEIERLTNAYIKRKEAGEELTGRIRDRVAQHLELSAAKAARLQAINSNLCVQGFVRDYQADRIGESVAYEISKLSQAEQYKFLDYTIEYDQPLTIATVNRFVKIKTYLRQCKESGTLCKNADRIYSKFVRGGNLGPCAGCCLMCLSKESCPIACEHVERPEPPVLPAPERAPRLAHVCETFSKRLASERERTGLDRKAFAGRIDTYPNTYSAWENGNLPGCDRVPALALVLGVTTDYLFGLSDDPAGGVGVPTGWRPLGRDSWPDMEQIVLLATVNALGNPLYEVAKCKGGRDDSESFYTINGGILLDAEDYMAWLPLTGVPRALIGAHDGEDE